MSAAPASQSNEDGPFHHAEGLRLASTGHLADAVKHFELAARLAPDNPAWHFNRGLAWHGLGHSGNAIAAYRRALDLAPDFFDAWNNLSAALKLARDFEPAVAAGLKAVSLRPNAPGAHLNLGNALKARDDLNGAEAAYRQARTLDPENPRIQVNLANTCRESGRVGEAIALLREVVARHPDFAEAHRDLAFALLLSGDLRAGWPENEWRWETEDMVKSRRSFAQPVWQGENLAGRRLLIGTEQGFGDAIQFVRYAALLAEGGVRVLLECQPPLKRLFRTISALEALCARGEPPPQFDFHAPLLSLPGILGTTMESIPNRVPYLRVPGKTTAGSLVLKSPGFRVGLVWAGNPTHQNDARRSLPVDRLRPLLDIDGISFYSLQVGARADEVKRLGNEAVDLGGALNDFAETAAAIDQLNLVLSVDSAVAHLAGALGQPVWLLLPFAPDWRWLLAREDSPWYPTMRLFRQERPGDWSGVIARVRRDLEAFG